MERKTKTNVKKICSVDVHTDVLSGFAPKTGDMCFCVPVRERRGREIESAHQGNNDPGDGEKECLWEASVRMTKEIVVIAVSYMPDTNRHITSSQMPGHTPIGFSHIEHRDSHKLSQQAGTQFLSLSHFLSLSIPLCRVVWQSSGKKAANGDSSGNKKYYYDYLVFLSFTLFFSCLSLFISLCPFCFVFFCCPPLWFVCLNAWPIHTNGG